MARRILALFVAGVSASLLQGCGEEESVRQNVEITRVWDTQAAQELSLNWDAGQWDDTQWL